MCAHNFMECDCRCQDEDIIAECMAEVRDRLDAEQLAWLSAYEAE